MISMRNFKIYIIVILFIIIMLFFILFYYNDVMNITEEKYKTFKINKRIDGNNSSPYLLNYSACNPEYTYISAVVEVYKTDEIEICGWIANQLGHPFKGWILGIDKPLYFENKTKYNDLYAFYIAVGDGSEWYYIFTEEIKIGQKYVLTAEIYDSTLVLYLDGKLQNIKNIINPMDCSNPIMNITIGQSFQNENHWIDMFLYNLTFGVEV